MTSSLVSMVAPNSIRSETVLPSLIPSSISEVIKARASGWFNLRPRALRFRESSAAVNIRSFSWSLGARNNLHPPETDRSFASSIENRLEIP